MITGPWFYVVAIPGVLIAGIAELRARKENFRSPERRVAAVQTLGEWIRESL